MGNTVRQVFVLKKDVLEAAQNTDFVTKSSFLTRPSQLKEFSDKLEVLKAVKAQSR